MSLIWWIIVICAFLLGFASLLVPMIPGVVVMWVGFLTYHFGIDHHKLSIWFWLAMVTLTIVILVSDYVAGSYFVKKYGGSKAGEITAALAVFAGSFIFPPFGILIVPFVAVLVVELVSHQDFKRAFDASIGSLFGFLASTLAKFMIMVVMILWFIFDIIV